MKVLYSCEAIRLIYCLITVLYSYEAIRLIYGRFCRYSAIRRLRLSSDFKPLVTDSRSPFTGTTTVVCLGVSGLGLRIISLVCFGVIGSGLGANPKNLAPNQVRYSLKPMRLL